MAVYELPRVPNHLELARVVSRHTTQGPVGPAKNIQNEAGAFACFIDENLLKQIVKHTNNRARKDLRAKSKNPDE